MAVGEHLDRQASRLLAEVLDMGDGALPGYPGYDSERSDGGVFAAHADFSVLHREGERDGLG